MSTIAENNDPTNPSYKFIVNCNPTGDVLKTCGKDSYVVVWTLSTAQTLFTDMRAAAMPLPMLQSPPTITILKVSGYAPCSGSQVQIPQIICRTPMIRMLWINDVLEKIILSLWPRVRPPVLELVAANNLFCSYNHATSTDCTDRSHDPTRDDSPRRCRKAVSSRSQVSRIGHLFPSCLRSL